MRIDELFSSGTDVDGTHADYPFAHLQEDESEDEPIVLSSTDPLDFSEQIEAVDEHQQAADALAAAVIERAQQAGAAISAEIRRETTTLMRRLVREGLSEREVFQNFMREFRLILRRYQPILARMVSDANLASWLQGGQGIVTMLPPVAPPLDPLLSFFERIRMGDRPPPAPPEWAIPRDYAEGPAAVRFPIIEAATADLARRNLLTSDEYYQANYRSRVDGFTVSNMASMDAMQRVRDALSEAVAQGDNLRTFRQKTQEAFDASGLSPSRQEMIFRTNLMSAYSRGQKAVVEQPLVQSVAVFAWRSEIRDSRLTELCRALSRGGFQGTSIYLVESEVWRRVAPISHFG